MLTFLIVLLFGQATEPGLPALDVSRVHVSQPALVAELDTGKLEGEPVGLAWNADGTLYLRVSHVDRWGNEKAGHYIVATASLPSSAQRIDGVPPSAAAYWRTKSLLVSPGNAALRIEVEERIQRARSTNTANAGDLAGMSSQALPPSPAEGPSSAAAMDAANKSYRSTVTTMRLKGQVVGEWENVAPQPGMRFGWAPASMDAIAYVNSNKRLALLDAGSHKLEVPGTANALLPAWSTDGNRIAFVQKKDKKRYVVMTIGVGR